MVTGPQLPDWGLNAISIVAKAAAIVPAEAMRRLKRHRRFVGENQTGAGYGLSKLLGLLQSSRNHYIFPTRVGDESEVVWDTKSSPSMIS
jgi:hypothetical protein